MAEFATIAEIKSRYGSQWVLIGDPEVDEHLRVVRGTVLLHSKDRDEVYRMALAIKPANSGTVFIGGVPQDTAVAL